MEKRQNFLLSALNNALFKKDDQKPNKKHESKETAASGLSTSREASTLTAPSNLDFTVHYVPESGGQPSDIDYTETRFDGPGSVLGKPIHGSDDPERAIMTLQLPKAGTSKKRMSLLIENEDGTVSDKVTVSRIAGNYDELRISKTKTASPVGEVKGKYFTMQVGDKFETYQNINQVDEVVLVENLNAETHKTVTLSFLALTTI